MYTIWRSVSSFRPLISGFLISSYPREESLLEAILEFFPGFQNTQIDYRLHTAKKVSFVQCFPRCLRAGKPILLSHTVSMLRNFLRPYICTILRRLGWDPSVKGGKGESFFAPYYATGIFLEEILVCLTWHGMYLEDEEIHIKVWPLA